MTITNPLVRAKYRAAAKAKRDARAIAAGRTPGVVGRPRRTTGTERGAAYDRAYSRAYRIRRKLGISPEREFGVEDFGGLDCLLTSSLACE